MAKTRPTYPPEFRRQLVAPADAGRAPDELPREFEPTAQSIRNWVGQSRRDAGQGDGDLTRAGREEPTGCGARPASCGWNGRSSQRPRPGSRGDEREPSEGLRFASGLHAARRQTRWPLSRHLTLERDAVGTVRGHGFHPPKAPQAGSISVELDPALALTLPHDAITSVRSRCPPNFRQLCDTNEPLITPFLFTRLTWVTSAVDLDRACFT
jgi:hypothetical protein